MKKKLIYIALLCFCSTISYSQIHFTFPATNDKFIAGSDTLITWEGIAPTDSVRLEYSSDNGKSWLMLSQKAMGMNYLWKKIPKKVGNKYLMRLIHKGEIVNKLDEPYIEWSKTYGGNSSDLLNCIQELRDGGYIAAGETSSSGTKGYSDIWILKVDSKGNEIFSKTYGGSKFDRAYIIKQTKDGGLITAGYSSSTDFDFMGINSSAQNFLMKLDNDGNVIWKKKYGKSSVGGFVDIQETDDSGFILVGDTAFVHPCADKESNGIQKIWILKIDETGNYVWSKTYGGNMTDLAYSIKRTKDNGYIVSGSTDSNCGDITENKGGQDAWLLKLDENGDLEWQKTYGGSGIWDVANSIQQTNNDDYIVFGSTDSKDFDINDSKGMSDIWVFKINKQGDIIWSKTYGGTNQDVSIFISKSNFTIDNCYIFAVLSSSIDGDITHYYGGYDGWFLKLDDDGNIKYQRNFGGSGDDFLISTQQTKDNGYIMAGYTDSNDGDVTENRGGGDGLIIKLGVKYQPIDTVMTTFSIVAPQPAARDVDMGKVYVGEPKDSTVTDFVYNIGDYKFRVDSIYIKGADKSAFTLIGGFPKYNVEPDSGKPAKFRFIPTRIGMHKAEIVIITQTDTLIQNIIGEGIKKRANITAELKPFDNLICENSTSTTLKIQSLGADTLRIKELNITGTDKSDFSINEPLPINIAPDSSKTIAIGFKTNVPGIKTAALEIKSNADPDSILTIPLTARKDSIALVPNPTLIDLGFLYPNQTKDSSFTISNLGTIRTDGKVTFTNNVSCANSTFMIDSGGVYKLDFTFTGITTIGNINEMITVWDDVCKYSRDVNITGKVVSPQLLGFSAVQCKSYSNEYKLTLQNLSSNKLGITSISIEKNPQLFIIDPSIIYPLVIDPYSTNNEVKVTYQDNSVQKFKTAVNCYTDNKFIPVLTDTIFAETVGYLRSTDGLINDNIHNAGNPFAVSYDSASQYGKNKFTYSIIVNKTANDMDYLTELANLEVVINYNRNVLGADFDSQSGNVKVRLGDDLQGIYSIKSAKETKIDEFNSRILVEMENTGKPVTTKDAYKLLEIDFLVYLSNYGLTDNLSGDNSRTAIISYSINSSDKCISYETANNAEVTIEKLCADNFRQIKLPENGSDHFYLNNVIPQPVGSKDATIEYGLGFECQVSITIYDLAGNIIIVPVNEIQKSGTHKQAISRKSLSAGTYFIEMKAGPFKETKKVIVE